MSNEWRVRLFLVAATTLPFLGATRVVPKPEIYGTFTVECRGHHNGTLTATVDKLFVRVGGEVTDADGHKSGIEIVAPLVGYHFAGTFPVGPDEMTVTGRVDPSDAFLRRPRLTGTWTTARKHTGRLVGGKR